MVELLSIIFYNVTACLLVSVVMLIASLIIEAATGESNTAFEIVPLISIIATITVVIIWVLTGLALGIYGVLTY